MLIFHDINCQIENVSVYQTPTPITIYDPTTTTTVSENLSDRLTTQAAMAKSAQNDIELTNISDAEMLNCSGNCLNFKIFNNSAVFNFSKQYQSALEFTLKSFENLMACNITSCENRCGNERSDVKGVCWCDIKCSVKSDCCIDYEYRCRNNAEMPDDIYKLHSLLKSRNSLIMYYQCREIPIAARTGEGINFNITKLLLISKCPWNSVNQSRCSSYRLQLAESNGHFFYNKYCALCHGFHKYNIQPYYAVCEKEVEKQVVWLRNFRLTESLNKLVEESCTLFFDPGENMSLLKCSTNDDRTFCLNEDSDIKYACSAYLGPQIIKTGYDHYQYLPNSICMNCHNYEYVTLNETCKSAEITGDATSVVDHPISIQYKALLSIVPDSSEDKGGSAIVIQHSTFRDNPKQLCAVEDKHFFYVIINTTMYKSYGSDAPDDTSEIDRMIKLIKNVLSPLKTPYSFFNSDSWCQRDMCESSNQMSAIVNMENISVVSLFVCSDAILDLVDRLIGVLYLKYRVNLLHSLQTLTYLVHSKDQLSSKTKCHFGDPYIDENIQSATTLTSANGQFTYDTDNSFVATLYTIANGKSSVLIESCLTRDNWCNGTTDFANSSLQNVTRTLGEYDFYINSDNSLFICQKTPFHEKFLSILIEIGLTLSILALGVLIVNNVCCKKVESTTYFMTAISISLLTAQGMLLANTFLAANRLPKWICMTLAIIQHLAWLTNFSQETAFCLWICHNLSSLQSMKHPGGLLVLAALLVPSLIVAMSIVLGVTGGRTYLQPDSCWLESSVILRYFFILPIGLCMAINLCTFIAMLRQIRSSRNLDIRKNRQQQLAPVAVRLFFLMGFTWILGLLANIKYLSFLWYVFVILNCFQGIYLFVCFGIEKKSRRRLQENSRNNICRKSRELSTVVSGDINLQTNVVSADNSI